jgi:hypothetical protein
MSEINAIATNNFILHNIDAKKLYVQEPLFTANSGDAVYVGWRPDETVLWTNTGSKWTSCTGFTLSEPISGFERIIYKAAMFNTDEYIMGSIVPGENATANISFFAMGYVAGTDGSPLQCWGTRYSTSDGLTYTRVDNKWMHMTLTGTSFGFNSNASDRCIMLNGITGINRISGSNT